jgi:recombination protein RecR
MKGIPESLNNLISEFSNLPGIGKKTAERLAIYVLKTDKSQALPLSDAIISVKNQIKFHDLCRSFVENGECVICDDSSRDTKLLCILKDPTDIFIIEKTGYNGLYHILGGLISPMDGLGPDKLNFTNLFSRLDEFEEVIIALEPSSEGDATSSYIINELQDANIIVSRLARGVPVGASFDYVDELTLTHSLNDRIRINDT